MKKWFLAAALALVVAPACEPDAADDDEPADQQETETAHQDSGDDQPSEPTSDQAEGPPAQPTDVTDDDEIGTLPEGVGIEPGESAPEPTAQNTDGDEVDLGEFVGEQRLVVFFYRGGWCPYCNFQVREFTEHYEDFDERDTLPVAISVDRPEAAADTDENYEIPFPVLSDPDLEVHEAFGVSYEADEEEVEQLAEMGMDVEAASGRDHHTYAVPAVFVVDREGIVEWAHADFDYSVRPSIEQLLDVLDVLDE